MRNEKTEVNVDQNITFHLSLKRLLLVDSLALVPPLTCPTFHSFNKSPIGPTSPKPNLTLSITLNLNLISRQTNGQFVRGVTNGKFTYWFLDC